MTVIRTRCSSAGPLGAALILTATAAAVADGVDRVVGQVDQDLLELAAIELDQGQVVRDVGRDLDAPVPRL